MKGVACGGGTNESSKHGACDPGVRADAESPTDSRPRRLKRSERDACGTGRRAETTPRSAIGPSADQLICTWKVTVAVPPAAASVPMATVICPAFVTLKSALSGSAASVRAAAL